MKPAATEEIRAVLADPAAADAFSRVAELIREQTDVTPLELLAKVVLETNDNDVADAIFTSYDRFLGVLADRDSRMKLEAASAIRSRVS